MVILSMSLNLEGGVEPTSSGQDMRAGYTSIDGSDGGRTCPTTPPGTPGGSPRGGRAEREVTVLQETANVTARRGVPVSRWATWVGGFIVIMIPVLMLAGMLGAMAGKKEREAERASTDSMALHSSRTEAGPSIDRAGAVAQEAVFVHNGRCAGTPMGGHESTESTLRACTEVCAKRRPCAYFSYNSESGGCALFSLVDGCPLDSDSTGHRSYIIPQDEEEPMHISRAKPQQHHHRQQREPHHVAGWGDDEPPSRTEAADGAENKHHAVSALRRGHTTSTRTTTTEEATTIEETTTTDRSTTHSPTTTTDKTDDTKRLKPYPSLYCFSVMQASTYELSLIRTQLARGAGIFACDDWAVFSDVEIWLSPGPPVMINSTVMHVDLKAKDGIQEHILNTQIFMEAWDMIITQGKYLDHQWVVKVDPDAVFLPSRLRTAIHAIAPKNDIKLYLLNCDLSFGFYGALEVLSSLAVWTYGRSKDNCEKQLPYKDWGEDLYMRRCLDLLGVPHSTDLDLLDDAYCGAKAGDCSSKAAAFHPYKDAFTYFNCLAEAEGDPEKSM